MEKDMLERIMSYEVKEDAIKTAGIVEPVIETEEGMLKKAALEKFASLPLEDALELVKPVVKMASFKESLEAI